jgi:hypothetical protein
MQENQVERYLLTQRILRIHTTFGIHTIFSILSTFSILTAFSVRILQIRSEYTTSWKEHTSKRACKSSMTLARNDASNKLFEARRVSKKFLQFSTRRNAGRYLFGTKVQPPGTKREQETKTLEIWAECEESNFSRKSSRMMHFPSQLIPRY